MIIYKTTNLINGKIYIGKYKGKNKYYFGSGKLIKQAIKKYGKENFIRETIEYGIDDPKILDEREIYWIAYYQSRNRNIGYNIAQGGMGNTNPSDETRRLISEGAKGKPNAMKGKKMGIESRKRMSENHACVSGSCNPMFKEKRTIEWRTRQSEYMKNKMWVRIYTEEERNKRSYNQIGKKTRKISSSKYVGVHFNNRSQKWMSVVTNIDTKKRQELGLFKFEVEAAMAYNEALIEFYGYKAIDKINKISKEEIESLWEME